MTWTLCWIWDVGQLYMELPNHSWKILLHQRISLGTTVNSRATCPNTCQPGATIVCRAICIYIYIYFYHYPGSVSTPSDVHFPAHKCEQQTGCSEVALCTHLQGSWLFALSHIIFTKGWAQLIKCLTEYRCCDWNRTLWASQVAMVRLKKKYLPFQQRARK